jgi:hypothetical protein
MTSDPAMKPKKAYNYYHKARIWWETLFYLCESNAGCIIHKQCYQEMLSFGKKKHQEAIEVMKCMYCCPYLQTGSQGWGKFGNQEGI